MKKITLVEGENEYTFGINRYKIIVATNYETNYQFKQLFFKLMRQSGDSEYYQEHNHNETALLINDKKINKKHILLTKIDSTFYLSDELKMSAKSLLLKYFERKLSSNEFNDTIQTLQILFDSLETEINEQTMFKIKFQKMSIKTLLKLAEAFIEKDDLVCNEYDLSYEELVLYQLDLLREIEKDLDLDHILVFVDLPIINEVLLSRLNEFSKSSFIIMTSQYPKEIDLSNFYLIGNISVDCANDEQLYYEVSERSICHYTLQEVQFMLLNYFYHKEQCTDDIISLFE